MGHRMTSFTADSMRGLVSDLAADFQARKNLVDSNRDSVGAMLTQSAKDRKDAETQRKRQSRRTTEARRRFVNRLRSGVTSLMGDFRNLRMEMASEIQAAGTVWRNRSIQDGGAAAFTSMQEPKASQTFHKGGRKGRA